MTVDVFIGYSREDAAAADSIQAYLTQAGLQCYRDVTNIPGSAQWVEEITSAIRDAHAFVALVSPSSASSRHVHRELTFADNFGKVFVPVLLSGSMPPSDTMSYYFGGIQVIPAGAGLEKALPQVLDAVLRAVDRSKWKAAYDDEADVLARATYQRPARSDLGDLGLPVEQGAGGESQRQSGGYVLASAPGSFYGQQFQSIPVTTEFVFETTIHRASGEEKEWCGIQFGAVYPGDFYQCLVNGRGQARISKHREDQWTQLVLSGPGAQRQGQPAAVRMKVVRQGGKLHMFVDGLHAATCEDSDIRQGSLGLRLGRGMRVQFTGLRLAGVGVEATFQKALEHWGRLEAREAKELLRYVCRYDPSFRSPDAPADAEGLLEERLPDRRETVLVAIGDGVTAQLHDRVPAERLRDEICRRGGQAEFRWAEVVSDTGLTAVPLYLECPVIAVGGPLANRITAGLHENLPDDPVGEGRFHVQHDLAGDRPPRRLLLWGDRARETAKAADAAISSGLLDRFLAAIWES